MEYNFRNYSKLIEKVDSFLLKVRNRYIDQIHCRKGCDSCCQAEPSVFAVEAVHLKRKFDELPLKIRNFISAQVEETAAQGGACPLLVFGNCAIYDSRPILCRTHGYPILVEDSGETYIDACSLNFRELLEAGRLERDFIINLQTLNITLAAVNQQFSHSTFGEGLDSGTRFPIGEAILADFDQMAQQAEGSLQKELNMASSAPGSRPPASTALFKRRRGEGAAPVEGPSQQEEPAPAGEEEEEAPSRPGILKEFITSKKAKKVRAATPLPQKTGKPPHEATPQPSGRKSTYNELFREATRDGAAGEDGGLSGGEAATADEIVLPAGDAVFPVDTMDTHGGDRDLGLPRSDEASLQPLVADEEEQDDITLHLGGSSEETMVDIIPEPEMTLDDVYAALDAVSGELRELPPRETLERFYPLRPRILKGASRSHGCPRKVQRGYYFGGPLPAALPAGCHLQILFAVTFASEELRNLNESGILTGAGVPGLVIAVPDYPLVIPDHMIEMEACERLREREQFAAGRGREALDTVARETAKKFFGEVKAYLNPGDSSLYHCGERLESIPFQSANQFYDALEAAVYRSAPMLDFPHLPGGRAGRTVIDEAQRILLEGKGRIVLSRADQPPVRELLEKVLVVGGLLEPRKGSASETTYAAQWPPPGTSPLRSVCDALARWLAQDEGATLEPLVRLLASPPYGVPRLLLEMVLFHAFAFTGSHTLCRGGESVAMAPGVCHRALGEPHRWSAMAVAIHDGGQEYLDGLFQILGNDAPAGASWSDAARAFRDWHEKLPLLSRNAEEPEVGARLLALLGRADSVDGRALLTVEVPRLFGVTGALTPQHGEMVLKSLRHAVLDIANFAAKKEAALVREICALFGAPPDVEGALGEALTRWKSTLSGIDAEGHLGEDAAQLVEMLGGDLSDVRSAFLEDLPVRFGLAPFPAWRRDVSAEYLARIRSVLLELRFFRLEGFFPVPEGEKQRKEHFCTWFDTVMRSLHIHGEERESVLVDLLESTVW